ncbi:MULTISPECIES: hypothetical protein [unclassified Virgibacillus]|uniref:hypothetical protein n=1 Tax=unclassified Virgibacillus TaxID=2620237 RepID=UPI0024DEF907|nr:hypothetical protein [Virgibacillus sp. LDC-1]
MTNRSTRIQRGQAISFRVPSNTPDHLLKHLQHLKETERRNFSSKIADYVLQGVGNAYAKERESITIPLPNKLTKAQRDWLKHEHSEALLGSIVYHLLSDPVRATALLAGLNSRALDIDEALFLQEKELGQREDSLADEKRSQPAFSEGSEHADVEAFTLDKAMEPQEEDTEEELEDLLGDFLAEMNK